jgi:hypothetical protein
VVFEHGRTISKIVKHATHLVSLDEKRKAFQPTLMNHDAERIQEVWFAGAHSDVGGGYRKNGLSDVALKYAIEWLQFMQQTQGLPHFNIGFTHHDCIKQACPKRLHDIISRKDISISPDPMGHNHQQSRTFFFDWFTLDDRVCCVMKHNKIDPTLTPLVHHSVAERFYNNPHYHPRSLRKTKHAIWHSFDGDLKHKRNLKDYKREEHIETI